MKAIQTFHRPILVVMTFLIQTHGRTTIAEWLTLAVDFKHAWNANNASPTILWQSFRDGNQEEEIPKCILHKSCCYVKSRKPTIYGWHTKRSGECGLADNMLHSSEWTNSPDIYEGEAGLDKSSSHHFFILIQFSWVDASKCILPNRGQIFYGIIDTDMSWNVTKIYPISVM